MYFYKKRDEIVKHMIIQMPNYSYLLTFLSRNIYFSGWMLCLNNFWPKFVPAQNLGIKKYILLA